MNTTEKYMTLSVTFYTVGREPREAFLEISSEYLGKVNKIRSAGLWFEGEYHGGIRGVTTTITGNNADYAICISSDPSDRSGHRAKVEKMIDGFDIERAASNERATA